MKELLNQTNYLPKLKNGNQSILDKLCKKGIAKNYDYYKIKASPEIAKNLVENIVEKGNSLDFQTKMGQKEELLLDRNQEFRYLVYKNYKIIYWFNEGKKRIEISDVFDARQNPVKIKRQK